MSDGNDWHDSLEEDLYEINRTKYVNWVIEALEDPDYKGMPLIVDPVSPTIMAPSNMPPSVMCRIMNWAKQFIEDNTGYSDDTIH